MRLCWANLLKSCTRKAVSLTIERKNSLQELKDAEGAHSGAERGEVSAKTFSQVLEEKLAAMGKV
jgi:hypothetical protein